MELAYEEGSGHVYVMFSTGIVEQWELGSMGLYKRVAVLPCGGAFDSPVRISPLEPDPGIMGRVVSAGSNLLIPVVGGFRAADPSALADAQAISLDTFADIVRRGTALAAITGDEGDYLPPPASLERNGTPVAGRNARHGDSRFEPSGPARAEEHAS